MRKMQVGPLSTANPSMRTFTIGKDGKLGNGTFYSFPIWDVNENLLYLGLKYHLDKTKLMLTSV